MQVSIVYGFSYFFWNKEVKCFQLRHFSDQWNKYIYKYSVHQENIFYETQVKIYRDGALDKSTALQNLNFQSTRTSIEQDLCHKCQNTTKLEITHPKLDKIIKIPETV